MCRCIFLGSVCAVHEPNSRRIAMHLVNNPMFMDVPMVKLLYRVCACAVKSCIPYLLDVGPSFPMFVVDFTGRRVRPDPKIAIPGRHPRCEGNNMKAED